MIKSKKAFGFSTIMYGVLLILFIYSSFRFNKNLNETLNLNIGEESNDLLKLVSKVSSYHNFLYNNLELDLSQRLDNKIYSKNYSILKTNFSDYVEDLFNKSFESDILKNVNSGDFIMNNFNELSFKTIFNYENPFLMKSSYKSNQKIFYSTKKEYREVVTNSYCEILDVDNIKFDDYSGCEKIFNDLYSRTENTKLSLFITAMSYLDTKCNKDNPFFIPISFNGDNRVDAKIGYNDAIDYIIDLFSNTFSNLNIDETYYVLSYIHHRGDLINIKNEIQVGNSYYDVIENHCYSHYKDNWDNYFEENLAAQTKYKFIQENYICNGPKMGLNYPGEVFLIYDLMCKDSDNEIKKETENRAFSVADYKTIFSFEYLLNDTLINFLFNNSKLNYTECKNSNQNLTRCVYNNIKSNLNNFNSRMNSYFINTETYNQNKLLFNEIKTSSVFSFSNYHKNIQNAINLISDFKKLNLKDMPECKVLDSSVNIKFNNNDIIYDNYILPTNFSFSQNSLNNKNLVLKEGYTLQLVNKIKIYPDCNDVYNFDNDPYYIPFTISNELNNKSLFIENNFTNEIKMSPFVITFSEEDLIESFKFNFSYIKNHKNHKNLKFIISTNPSYGSGQDSNAKEFYVYEKDKDFEIFDYNFTKKINMNFPINGTTIYFKAYAYDWFGNIKYVSINQFKFKDETAFDFAVLKNYNHRLEQNGFYSILSDSEGKLNLEWEKNLKFYDNDKKVYVDYFDDQLAFYNIYYVEKSKELDKEFDVKESMDLNEFRLAGKTNETLFSLEGLKPNQEYYVAIAQVDKSGNIPLMN